MLRLTVNNDFFTMELYEKIKKIRWEVIDGTKPVTDQYRIYKIYSVLSSMKLEELPDDTPMFSGGISLSLVLKDGTKTSFALGQYLCINNKKYAISEQRKTVDKLGNLLRKYAL